MSAHTLRDGNLRQMARAVGPLANGLWKMEVRGRPQLYSFRPIAPMFERQQRQAATVANPEVRIPW